MDTKVNPNNLQGAQLISFINHSLFDQINDGRDLLQISKLFYDTAAEKAIESFFFDQKESDQELESYLQANKFVSKNRAIVRLSKQFKDSHDNDTIYKNLCCLIQENTMNKKMPLLDNNNCFTHVGLNIKYDTNIHQYFILCILSQKVVTIEESIALKDGYVLIGQILSMNYFIYGVKIMKNEKIGYDIGPKNISYAIGSSKFGVLLPKLEFKDLMMRKVYCYLVNQDQCQIPYGNPQASGNSVPWQNLELGICQVVDFKKSKELLSQTIDSFVMSNGIENYSNMQKAQTTSVPKPPEQKTTGLTNRLALISRLSQKTSTGTKPASSNANPILVLTPNNKGNTLSPSFGNQNVNKTSTTPMMTIQEENFNNLNQSFMNSTQKLNVSPICPGKVGNTAMNDVGMSSNFCLGTNQPTNTNMQQGYNSSNVADFIGNRLQKAEMLTSNINSASILPTFGQSNNMINSTNTQNNNNISFNPIQNNSNNSYFNNQNNNVNQNTNATMMNNTTNVFGNTNMNQNNTQLVSLNQMTPFQNDQFNNNNPFNPNMNNQMNTNLNNCQINPQNQPATQTLYNSTNMNMINQPQPQNFFQPNQTMYNNPPQTLNNQLPLMQQPNMMNDPNMAKQNQLLNLKPSKTVLTWQLIPNDLQYKNLLDVKGVGTNYVNQMPKMSFSKDPRYCIHLSQFSSGNVQSYTVTPQTKKEFMIALEEFLFKNKITQKDKNKFLFSNLEILIENSRGQLKPIAQIFNKEPNNILPFNHQHQLKEEIVTDTKSSVKYKNKISNNCQSSSSIDSYIFKDSLWTQTLQKNKDFSSASQEKVESLNDRILQNIIKKYLSPKEASSIYNYNPSYEELYKTKNFSDIILTIKGEEILSHKVVLISQSPVFKEMIKQNEQKGVSLMPEIIKIVLPDSYNPVTFKEIIKWIYCGIVKEGLSIDEMREMLIMADNLKIYSLQKILIVKHIIPNLTKESSLLFLKDTYKKVTPKETSEVWNLLANFSINCISKNSSVLIKTHREAFLSMDVDLLFKVVEFSTYYLVEEIHLSLLIKLIIDKGYASDIFALLIKISDKFKTCRNFNIQNINIDSILNAHKSIEPFDISLLKDDINNNSESTSMPSSENISNASLTNSRFSFGIAENDRKTPRDQSQKQIEEIQTYSSNSPKTNTPPSIDIKKNKSPIFEFSFQLTRESNVNPLSIFSECFHTNNHSWSLKVDIYHNGNVSFYLIERGNSSLHTGYSLGYEINFTSVLCEFEIRDTSFEKSGVFFFSFSNNQHQIIGYDNFFNLKQLGKKDSINFRVWLKEFPLHAACLQHLSDNFQPLFLKKKGKNDLKEIELNMNISNQKSKTYVDLYPFDVASILYNDNLRVDNENNVVSALYLYCINKESNVIDPAMGAVRYEFVDFKIMCTLARDHEIIKHSPMFKIGFTRELTERINKLNRSSSQRGNLLRIDIPRKYYTFDGDKRINISNDLISFFLEKNHHEGYREKLLALEKCLEDERKEHEKKQEILQRQNRELKMEMQRLNEMEEKRRKYMESSKYRKQENSNNIQSFLSGMVNLFKPK